MITWCVAYTQPHKEPIAKKNLLDQDFEVYLPRFKKLRRHARKIEEVLSPLFPRYIFVGMDLEKAMWRSINSTRGVSHLVMSDNCRPANLPCQIVDKLKSQEVSKEIVTIDCLVNFTKGEKVRILEGTFEDQIAIFKSLDDKGRVQLLLNLLGKEVKFSLPHYAVEAA